MPRSRAPSPLGSGAKQRRSVKHFIIGAGASLAEARALGNPPEFCPPLIRDFARKTWSNYTPHPVLEAYLRDLGYDATLAPSCRKS